MSRSYTSVDRLIEDMQKYLLPQKLSVALQYQLQNKTQGSKSVETFGKELEELFVGLTISQSEGDSSKYKYTKYIASY